MRALGILSGVCVILLASCQSSELERSELDLMPALRVGDWIEHGFYADLRGYSGPVAENPLLWKPLSVVPVHGWERAGRGWRPVGSRSELRFWVRAPEARYLTLELRNRTEGDSARDYSLGIRLNGRRLEAHRVEPGRFRARWALDPGLLADENSLELAFEPALMPDRDAGHPIALLGLALSSSVGDARPAPRAGSRTTAGEGTIGLYGSGTLVVPLPSLAPLESLSLDLRHQGSGPATVMVQLLDGEGDWRPGASGTLSSGQADRISVHSPSESSSAAALSLSYQAGSDDSRLEVEGATYRPMAVQGTEGSPRVGTGRTEEDRLPDVVLIILDAARGDRFPGWDYPRTTMPNVDRLASSALVFQHAYAECPTTSCSIPALLTGVSLLPGGEVGKGRQMSPELITLAEYLRELGYRTVGYSATPNNSANRNMDQGFDDFFELWGRDNPNHGPFNLSRLAAAVVATQPADRPLYLQLHYLPPHQPYDPGPEFDRFTDPNYVGPITPKMSLKPYSLGRAELAPADLSQLIGLYDGNLLRADAAVERLLSALRESGRYENSIIIITSDHGEAFMEHGYQGHNTTLYDEMLHVPLVVRLPYGRKPDPVDERRLASLLDVVPTVLGRLRSPAVDAVDGIDLLAPRSSRTDDRVLMARTSHGEQPMISMRSRVWKSIAWPKHQVQMLFDLTRDPGELDNRVGTSPMVYAVLGLAARDRLRESQKRDYGRAGEVTIDAETEEALRALGYLD